MIKFRHYPIHILYSHRSQVNTDDTAFSYHVRGDRHMYEYLKYGTGQERMEIVEDSAPADRPAVVRFEGAVMRAMNAVYSSRVGRCVLDGIKKGQKLYIIPYALKTNGAITMKVSEMGGGGIRVKINPEDWRLNFDDTLLHELVHALRLSYDRLEHRRLAHPNFEDADEFMATQVSNIYRSSIGKTGFYDIYPEVEGRFADLGTVYSTMIDSPLYVVGLKYCMDQEAFVRDIAKLPLNVPPFNPFRDYPVLERKALGKMQQSGMPAPKLVPL